jgi:hypothetical protein
MGCLLPIGAIFMPRIVLVLILIFTHWLGRAYDTVIWPLLGFVFMPYTTLAYMAVMLNNGHKLEGGGFWTLLFIIAIICDLVGQGGSVAGASEP